MARSHPFYLLHIQSSLCRFIIHRHFLFNGIEDLRSLNIIASLSLLTAPSRRRACCHRRLLLLTAATQILSCHNIAAPFTSSFHATPRLSEDKIKQCVDPKLGVEYPPKAIAKFGSVVVAYLGFRFMNCYASLAVA
ncbi:hypothetical protein AHAS_Ahas10G0112500 [Arachis hypogaea]